MLTQIAAWLDWRSVRAMGCCAHRLEAIGGEPAVVRSAKRRSIAQNWRDGRAVAYPLPDCMARAHQLHATYADEASAELLFALVSDDLGHGVLLFDIDTHRPLERFDHEGHIANMRIATDKRRALVAINPLGYDDNGCAVHLYPYENADARAVFQINDAERACCAPDAVHITRRLDRVLVYHERGWARLEDRQLLSHDVGTGGLVNGTLSAEWAGALHFADANENCVLGASERDLLRVDFRVAGMPRAPIGCDMLTNVLTMCGLFEKATPAKWPR